jgi:hypothetical protein
VANTNYYKSHVEPYVRTELERIYNVAFSSRILTLTTGGTHEFDAVAADNSIVASVKSLSGKTAGGKRPAAKYSTCLAELYFLSLVSAPKRILVLTTPDWHTMFTRYIEGRLVPGVEIQLLRLPTELQAEVDRVTALASGEVSFSRESSADSVMRDEAGVETEERYSPGHGCRDEILVAAAHLHSLGQADFTPDEIVRYMGQQHSRYAVSTIQTHVVSLMCANAPKNHGTKYADLLRTAPGRYRLLV